VITVGNIDSTMDSREVLKKTIGTYLNDSLREIFGNYLVLHMNANDSMVLLSDKPPSLELAQDIKQFLAKKIWQLVGVRGACCCLRNSLFLDMLLVSPGP
jgi:lactam utilization protein B